jgi:trimeric autotransporter adhesin
MERGRSLPVYGAQSAGSWSGWSLWLLVAALAGCGGGGSKLVSVAVTPGAQSIDVGGTALFRADLQYSCKTPSPAPAITWTVSDATVAKVDGSGQVLGLRAGTVSVMASAGGKTGTASLTVRAPPQPEVTSVGISPETAMVAAGETLPLTATAQTSAGESRDVSSTAAWSSSDQAVATVSENGLLTAVAPGRVTIVATFGALMASAAVLVTEARLTVIAVGPADLTLTRGSSQQYTATASFTDGSSRDITGDATWASSDGAVVLVADSPPARGLVTAVGVGTAMVSASLSGITGAATVSVSPPTLTRLAIDPTALTVPRGVDAVFRARGLFSDGSVDDVTALAVWESSDAAVAAPLAAPAPKGSFSTVAMGSAIITARLGQEAATTTLTVSPATLNALSLSPFQPRVPVGLTLQLRATGVYSDNSTHDVTEQAAWSSSVATVVAVSDGVGSRGLASFVAAGSSTVSASFGGVMAATTVTGIGATRTSLVIVPGSAQLARGSGLRLRAVAGYSDGVERDLTDQLPWMSSASQVAEVSSAAPTRGLLRAVSAGSALVTAGAAGGASATVTVTDAVLVSLAVTPSPLRMARGTALPLRALGTYSDGTVQDLTALAFWESQQPALAAAGNAAGGEGRVEALAEGAVTVTARFGGHLGSGAVVVTDARLSSMRIEPSSAQVSVGGGAIFRAQGRFSDDTAQDISDRVLWTSSNPAVAVVSNGLGSRGLAVGLAPGESTISARFADVDTSSTLTVVP